MKGILIATHGELSTGIVNSCSLLMGISVNIKTLSLYEFDDVIEFKDRIKSEIMHLDTGEGVLVFTDLYGGSPCNLTMELIGEMRDTHKVYCLSGVNLPMVLQAITLSNSDISIAEAYETCFEAGTRGIVRVNDALNGFR